MNIYRCNEINVENIYRYIILRMNYEVWILIYIKEYL